MADWHIRDETYALALQRLVNQQLREPLAAIFGNGVASSSDGQFFRAGGFGRDAVPRDSKVGRSATRRMAGLVGFRVGIAQS